MLYSTGPVQVFLGLVTTFIGMTSSKKIVTRTQVTTAEPSSTANASSPVTIQPAPQAPDVPAALGQGVDQFDLILKNVESGGTEPSLGPPQQVQLPPKPPLPQNASLQPLQSLGKRKTSTTTSSVSRPIVFSSAQMMYLGTGERAPNIQVRPRFRPIYQTDTGKIIEFDKAYSGRDAIISMTLNDWQEPAYELAAARMNARAGGGPRGVDRADSIGSLLLTEGLAFMLFLQFPNSAKGIMAAGGMPAGYRFFAAYPIDEMIIPGTPTNSLKLVWHAIKVYDFGSGDQWLFDHDLSLVPQLTSVY